MLCLPYRLQGLNCEPNSPVYIFDTNPNDPAFTGAAPFQDPSFQQWGIRKIRAPAAWDITTGDAEIFIGVLDSGIDYNHPDLAGALGFNYEEYSGQPNIDDDNNGFVDDLLGVDLTTNSTDPFDNFGHGTHVSGIIGAKTNNLLGIAGTTWKTGLVPVKVVDSSGNGTLANLIRGIYYAVDRGASVLNISLGTTVQSSALEEAITYARSRGVIVVAAAGNSASNNDQNPVYPANIASDNMLSVAASDRNDALTTFSNFGARTVDLAAPGLDIMSTVIRPSDNLRGYQLLSGTSMAAPHVTGVVALMLAVNFNLTNSQIRSILLATVDPVPALAGRVISGGRVNALKAVQAAAGGPQPTNTPTSTPTRVPTQTPTNTPSNTPTDSPTNSPTSTPTNTRTLTPTSSPTLTPSPTPTPIPTDTPTRTPTPLPTDTPTEIPTQTHTPSPTSTTQSTPTRTSTNTPSPTKTPTATHSPSPTLTPTAPTNTPSVTPTFTASPTATSSASPTMTPTHSPTTRSTDSPTPTPMSTSTTTATATLTATPLTSLSPSHTATPSVSPTIAPQPPRFDAGKELVIFTTRRTYQGELGGRDGAQERCTTSANLAGLQGIWYPLLGDTLSDPRDVTGISENSSPIFNTAGERIAHNRRALWLEELLHAPNFDEYGVQVSASVFTGSGKAGVRAGSTADAFCDDWKSANEALQSVTGTSNARDETWHNRAPGPCSERRRIYCIGERAAPPTHTPSPSQTATPESTRTTTPTATSTATEIFTSIPTNTPGATNTAGVFPPTLSPTHTPTTRPSHTPTSSATPPPTPTKPGGGSSISIPGDPTTPLPAPPPPAARTAPSIPGDVIAGDSPLLINALVYAPEAVKVTVADQKGFFVFKELFTNKSEIYLQIRRTGLKDGGINLLAIPGRYISPASTVSTVNYNPERCPERDAFMKLYRGALRISNLYNYLQSELKQLARITSKNSLPSSIKGNNVRIQIHAEQYYRSSASIPDMQLLCGNSPGNVANALCTRVPLSACRRKMQHSVRQLRLEGLLLNRVLRIHEQRTEAASLARIKTIRSKATRLKTIVNSLPRSTYRCS